MAAIAAPNPYDSLNKQMPRTGPPVQNMGGFGRNTAPIGQRPIQTPSISAAPGPAQMSPSPNPSGVAAPTGFQAAIQKAMLPKTASGGYINNAAAQIGEPTAPVPPPAPPAQAPAPTPPAPAPAQAPGPAPAPGTSSSSSSSELYGKAGGISPGTKSTLEDQLRNYITGAMSGSVSPEFINRAKQDVFRTVQGQTKQGMNAINSDAISRGLFKSGIPAESAANLQGQAQGAISRGVADVLNNAENVNIQGRQAAAGTAGNLLSANREWDQYSQQRSDAAAARVAANAPKTFTYIDPDTGQSYQMDESWF